MDYSINDIFLLLIIYLILEFAKRKKISKGVDIKMINQIQNFVLNMLFINI